MTSLGLNVEFAHKKDDAAKDDASVLEIADVLYKKFSEKKTDKVMVAYSDYKSAISQEPVLKQLFPFEKEPQVGREEDEASRPGEKNMEAPKTLEYLYEPNKYDLLEYLIPRIAQVQLYQALLESNASEHSARMVAMKSASDAAKEMADDLVLVFNKARQSGITQEIAEISAGRAAVS